MPSTPDRTETARARMVISFYGAVDSLHEIERKAHFRCRQANSIKPEELRPYRVVPLCAVDAVHAQYADLVAAAEKIAARQPKPPRDGEDWDGECCTHTEDGHKHGIDIGDWKCGEIARAALSALPEKGS